MLRIRIDKDGELIYTIKVQAEQGPFPGWSNYTWECEQHTPSKQMHGQTQHKTHKGILQLFRIILIQILGQARPKKKKFRKKLW